MVDLKLVLLCYSCEDIYATGVPRENLTGFVWARLGTDFENKCFRDFYCFNSYGYACQLLRSFVGMRAIRRDLVNKFTMSLVGDTF